MNTLTSWLKKSVIVTLNTSDITTAMQGTLVEVDDRLLTLQQGQRRFVISMHNVLHVTFNPE
jgi:hypothetical protein